MNPLLTANGLSRPGLGPVDFELAHGEVLAVIGPSGSGKSLLLRALADLDPNDGEVRLDNINRSDVSGPEWRRKLTYVPATPGWWAPTPEEHFRELDRDRAKTMLPRLNLPDEVWRADVDRISTGEGQRLAMLRALVQSPVALLLDEPTAALDSKSKRAVEALLHDYLSDSTAIMIATHDEEQVKRLTHRCLRVAPGGAVTEGRL